MMVRRLAFHKYPEPSMCLCPTPGSVGSPEVCQSECCSVVFREARHEVDVISSTFFPALTRELWDKIMIDDRNDVWQTHADGDSGKESPPVQFIGINGSQTVNLI